MLAGILRFIDRLSQYEGQAASFLIVVATVQICYELVLRYVFNVPTIWGLEVTLYLCATTYVMAGAYAERYNAHIRVDIFYSRWKPRTRALFDLFVTDVLFFFFVGALLWYSAAWFWEAWTQGLTSGTIWDPRIWPMRLVLVLGAGALLLAGIAKSLRDAVTAFGGTAPDAAPPAG